MTSDKLADLVSTDRKAMADMARATLAKPNISLLDAFNEIRSTIYENTSMIDAAVVTGIASAIVRVTQEQFGYATTDGRGERAASERPKGGDFSSDFSRDFEQN